jgi:hypothetical protein
MPGQALPELAQEDIVPLHMLRGPAERVLDLLEGKHDELEARLDAQAARMEDPIPDEKGQVPEPPGPPQPEAVEDKEEKKRQDVALLVAALRTNAEALMDRRNMDNKDDVAVYRRSVYSQAKASELTKLGVDVWPLVDQIILECEDRVLKERNVTAKKRVISHKPLGIGWCAWYGLTLQGLPNSKLSGAPMSRVLGREAMLKQDLRQPSPTGEKVYEAAQTVSIVAHATAEEGFRAGITRVCVFVAANAVLAFNPLARVTRRYGILLSLTGWGRMPLQTRQVIMRARCCTADNWVGDWFAARDALHFGGLASIGVSSIAFAAIETYRMRGSYTSFAMRVMGHAALGTFAMQFGVIPAICAHAAYNLVMVRYYPGALLELSNSETRTVPNLVVSDLCCEHARMKTVKIQPDFKVTREPETRCTAGFGAQAAWGVKGLYADVMRTCHHNETKSLNARVGKLLPQHEPAVAAAVAAEWKKVTELTLPIFAKNVKKTTLPIPFEEWIKTFPPAKREMYTNLVATNACVPQKLQASSFVKKELVLREEEEIALVKDPRMIQGCPPELSLHTGPYIRRAAKNLKEGMKPQHYDPQMLAQGKHFIYTCGMTAEGVGASFTKALAAIEGLCGPGERVVVLEDDQSRFDLHITGPAFEHLHQLNLLLLPKKVARFLRRTDKSTGRTMLGCRYSVPYTMQSGWPDTSYGDSICNESMKLYVHRPGRKWISIICGDDSVTVTTDQEIEALGGPDEIVRVYAKLGMEVEVCLRSQEEYAEFCSARFYQVKGKYIMFPKPGKMIARLGWDMQKRTAGNQAAWARGVVETMAHYGQIDPLLNALSRSLKRQLGMGKVIKEDWNEYKHMLDARPAAASKLAPMSDVYYYYACHYGFSAEEVDRAVALLDSDIVRLHELCDHPLIVALCRSDL